MHKDKITRRKFVAGTTGATLGAMIVPRHVRLTETMLLGVVAMRTGQGKRIYYDGEAGKITNVAEANQYLQREYRKGWSL